jgi:poly(ADP-ribose) glycohydrolase ARH3
MLGVAIGDALGAPFEGSPPSDPSAFSGWESRVPHPLRYTDDTLMTLGVARALVECGGRFDGARMAAMRSAPVGLLHFRRPSQADAVARVAARITHTHELGMDGAALIACAAGLLVQTSEAGALDATSFLAAIRRHARTRELRGGIDAVARLDASAPPHDVIRILGNGIEAHRSVPTAVHALLRRRESFAAAVAYAVSLGGDADTIASMTGALAGALHGASAIPLPWRDAVEGRDDLIELAERLLALAP